MSRQQELGLPEDVAIFPPRWPEDGVARPLLPGDLSQFAANRGPQQTDLAQFHPFRFDSKIHPGGGLIYFDECADPAEVSLALRLMGVDRQMRDYAVFAASAAHPAAEDFLDQLRFVSHHALACGYRIWGQDLRPQPISLLSAVEAFIVGQRKKWNARDHYSARLAGARGGDGDGEKEALGFGFMAEDVEWRIYRLWSRAWLITK